MAQAHSCVACQAQRHKACGALAAQPWCDPGPLVLAVVRQRGEQKAEVMFLQRLGILFL